jgi:hypothetical protein
MARRQSIVKAGSRAGLWAPLGAACAVAIQGCASDPRLERRFQARVDGMDRTLRLAAHGEEMRPEMMARTLRAADRQVRHDVDALNYAFNKIDQLVTEEVERLSRNRERYERHLWHAFWGQPENIAPTAITLFP